MSEHYPRVRLSAWTEGLRLRESMNITLFMPHSHEFVAQAVMQALQIYMRAVGPRALGWYGDDQGEWQPLDTSGWEIIRRQLLEKDWPGSRIIDLCERPEGAPQYRVEYCGNHGEAIQQGAVCAMSFWLPTEYLEDQGPSRVRDLAWELAASLPFCSGHAGLAFNHLGAVAELDTLRLRYPGMDDFNLMRVSWNIGTRVRGPSWMNFLAPPVLEALGGLAGLRSRLSSPDISVQALPGERAVVTLGPWPEAGDTEQEGSLPLYRELARVLEPWLYQSPPSQDALAAEQLHRWERRFLD